MWRFGHIAQRLSLPGKDLQRCWKICQIASTASVSMARRSMRDPPLDCWVYSGLVTAPEGIATDLRNWSPEMDNQGDRRGGWRSGSGSDGGMGGASPADRGLPPAQPQVTAMLNPDDDACAPAQRVLRPIPRGNRAGV